MCIYIYIYIYISPGVTAVEEQSRLRASVAGSVYIHNNDNATNNDTINNN